MRCRYVTPDGASSPNGQISGAAHGAAPLPAAYELHYLDLGSWLQYGVGPTGLFDYPAVEFYRDARGVQPELFDESQDGLSFGGCAGFAVEDDLYGHRSVDTLVLQPL